MGSKTIADKPQKSGGNRTILWLAVAAAVLLMIFINGEQYQGDFTPEAFKAAVEAALEAGL